jgi:molybdopterin-guanine dinucleotide biosynthesis protein A
MVDERLSTHEIPTGIILAGGKGTRVGGADKGLLHYCGRPLIHHMLDILNPVTNNIVVNCNRSDTEYARLGYPVVSDATQDFDGPLAGIVAAGQVSNSAMLCVVPCDTPHLSSTVLSHLVVELRHCDAVYAHDGQRPQPLVCALRRSCLPSMADYLHAGGRSAIGWFQHVRGREVRFSNPQQFININQVDQLDDSNNNHLRT